MIRLARGTAMQVRASVQRFRSVGRRASPRSRRRSSWYPAAAIRSEPWRPRTPTKLTSAPRATSASASASAGMTCPAVPPAAITIDGGRPLEGADGPSLGGGVASDVDEESSAGKVDDEGAAAEGDEGERHAGHGEEP